MTVYSRFSEFEEELEEEYPVVVRLPIAELEMSTGSCPAASKYTVTGFSRYSDDIRLLPNDQQKKLADIAAEIARSWSGAPGAIPVLQVLVTGHADQDPARERREPGFLQFTSERRAQAAIVDLHCKLGWWPPKGVHWLPAGRGTRALAISNPRTEEERKCNRRVEITLMRSPMQLLPKLDEDQTRVSDTQSGQFQQYHQIALQGTSGQFDSPQLAEKKAREIAEKVGAFLKQRKDRCEGGFDYFQQILLPYFQSALQGTASRFSDPDVALNKAYEAAKQAGFGALQAKKRIEWKNASLSPPQPMGGDCEPDGRVSGGPPNHVFCRAHNHILDTKARVVIAHDLEGYKRRPTTSRSYESALFEGPVGGVMSAVDPFPRNPYILGLEMVNENLINCASGVESDPDTRPMCGAVADLTGNPDLPAFYAHNPVDMVYVGSLAKVYALYVAFELRRRVQQQAKDMIKLGLSTATAGWERQVFTTLEKAWRPKLRAAFPRLPEGMPKFADIFVLSPTGEAKFAQNDPPLTDADLDFRPPNPKPGKPPISPEFKEPRGKFLDWMRLMLRWSNNDAASKCIRALSYPYINGLLTAAGFFNKKTRAGLWLSGDYANHDWLKLNVAGQPLSPRWARLQGRKLTNFAGTAFQVARLMMFIARSPEMVSLMTGVHGIRSYIRDGLAGATPPRAFTEIASKIGCGDEVPPPACGFSHDCAIVRIDRGEDPARTIRYVAVALGSHPDWARANLRKMVVRFHDCVVSRHP
jgi:hypothetical protein